MNRRTFLPLFGLGLATPLLANQSKQGSRSMRIEKASGDASFLSSRAPYYQETFKDELTGEFYLFVHTWEPCFYWSPGSPSKVRRLIGSEWVTVTNLKWDRNRLTGSLSWEEPT